MSNEISHPNDLDNAGKVRLIMEMFHRAVVHHGLWFAEVRHQMGQDRALELLHSAWDVSFGIQLKRLAKLFGFELRDGLPAPLLDMSPDQLDVLLKTVAVNWLANDGVWFQSVEFSQGMNDAKRCNDSCWAQFSPFEAFSIRKFLDLGPRPGLEGLKKALNFRLYSTINVQSIVDEGPDRFVFQMNECRVQAARKRKGLADYPCKTAGMVEYPYFARAIDDRIRTECVGCPPDDHPDQWYCAWRFILDSDA